MNRPVPSQWQFGAPSDTAEPATTSPTAESAVNGGHNKTSTPRGRFSPSRMASANSRASAIVPCIFQLPTTRGMRMGRPLALVERGNARQHAPFEIFEKSAARGRDVPDARGDAGLLDGRDRVAASDHRESAALAHGPRD